MYLRKVLATFAFEFSRSMTISRISTSLILALFTPVMLFFIFNSSVMGDYVGQIMFPLLVLASFHLLAVLLSVLLWATPVVYSELEGKTWTYLAIRPQGKICSTIGKFLNAVFWATLTATFSLAICCTLVYFMQWEVGSFLNAEQVLPADVTTDEHFNEIVHSLEHSSHPVVIGYSLFACILFGALGYSAIFVHVGLLAHRRGMVVAVVYSVMDNGFSLLPAMLKQFTVSYHLRNLGLKLAGFETHDLMPTQADSVLKSSEETIWWHFAILILITVGHLVAASYWLHSREYVTVKEE